jgi:hypothetical protein
MNVIPKRYLLKYGGVEALVLAQTKTHALQGIYSGQFL